MLEGRFIIEERGKCMQGKEPAPRLVEPLDEQVGREGVGKKTQQAVGRWILRIGHGARVEPDIDDFRLAVHFLPAGADEDEVIDIRSVRIKVRRQGLRHIAGGDRFADLLAEFLEVGDADFFVALFGAPDGEGRAPEAGAAQVPVDQVVEPLREATLADGGGLPLDLFVEGEEFLFVRRGPDEPGLQWIVEDRLSCAPAVGVAVHMRRGMEDLVFTFQFLRDLMAHRWGRGLLLEGFGDVFRSYILVGKVGDGRDEASLQVYDGVLFPTFVRACNGGELELLGEGKVLGTKGRGDVHDACPFRGRDEVSRDDPESPRSIRSEVGKKRLIRPSEEVAGAAAPGDAPGEGLAPLGRGRVRDVLLLRIKVAPQRRLGEDDLYRLLRVGIEGLYRHVGNIGAHRQSRIGGERPWRRRPGEQVGIGALLDFELGDDGEVFDLFVATGLVQLMAAQGRPRCRGVGLYAVALVEESFFIEALEESPQHLYIAGRIGKVGIFEWDPVADAPRDPFPLFLIALDRRLACFVVVADAYFLADLLFGDGEFLFHGKLYRQSMGIPACAAHHLIALHRLVAPEEILEGADEEVMNAGASIESRGAFIKEKRFLILLQGGGEGLFLFPLGGYFRGKSHQIQLGAVGIVLHGIGKLAATCRGMEATWRTNGALYMMGRKAKGLPQTRMAPGRKFSGKFPVPRRDRHLYVALGGLVLGERLFS